MIRCLEKVCGTVGWNRIGLGRIRLVMTEMTHLIRPKQPNPSIRPKLHRQNYPGPKRLLSLFRS